MKKLLIVVCASLLSACASQSAYMAADGSRDYGYSENQLTENRYRVHFKGNGRTGSDEVKDMALLRAAELTLLNDYDWFRVVNQETDQQTSTTQQASTTLGPNQRVFTDCGLLGCTTTVTPAYTGVQVVSTRDIDRYNTSIEIVMGKGELEDSTAAYNALEIRNSLAQRY